MNFQEAERAYQDLRAQYSAGKLSNSDFEAQVSKLKVQDAEGRWWQIGVQSGEWYVHDGQKWSKGRPPAETPSAPSPAPGAPPEAPAAAAGAGVTGAAAAGAPPPKTTPKRVVAPRVFSAAPAGRAGGLPTPALIGIIALVAIIGLVVIIAAFLFLSGQLGGTATAPRTATPIAVAPTTGLPTIPPAVATNTAVVLPTLPPVVIAPTAAITPTRVLTGTAPTPSTGGGVTTTTTLTTTRPVTTTAPTATRRPVTPTVAVPKVVATATPKVPPGIYVTAVRTSPAKPNPGDQITFYVTFLNTSGQTGPTPWIVKIFRCEAACTGDELAVNKSIGETPKTNSSAPVGTAELSAGPWLLGIGACNLVAIPYYVDSASGQVLPFVPTTGQDRFYYNFKGCQ